MSEYSLTFISIIKKEAVYSPKHQKNKLDMRTTLLILFTLFALELAAQSKISGKWKIGTSNSTVEIVQQKENYKGRITKVTNDNRKQEVEQLMLTNINYIEVLDMYTCKMKVTNGVAANCEFRFLNHSNNKLIMTAKFLFFTKTVLFQRIN